MDITDPQTWNRYAYVRDTPTSLVDPLGLQQGELPPNYCPASVQRCSNLFAVPPTGFSIGPVTTPSLDWNGAYNQYVASVAESHINNAQNVGVGLAAAEGIIGGAPGFSISGNVEIGFSVHAPDPRLLPGSTPPISGNAPYLATSRSGGGGATTTPNSPTPTCYDVFGRSFLDSLSPAPSLTTLAQPAADAYAQFKFSQAIAYAASKPLSYPFKSSIFRTIINASQTGGYLTVLLTLDFALGQAVWEEAKALSNGECRP